MQQRLQVQGMVQQTNLAPPISYPQASTHKHYRGPGSSTIDYILTDNQDLLSDIEVLQENAQNTSSHYPVTACVNCILPPEPERKPKNITKTSKVKWTRCDKALYKDTASDLLPEVYPADDSPTTEAYCATITESLHYAAKVSTPATNTKKKSRKRWTDDISQAMACNREAVRQWRDAGKPDQGPVFMHKTEMKKTSGRKSDKQMPRSAPSYMSRSCRLLPAM